MWSLGIDATQQPQPPRWLKGNLHTHTRNSDGDAAPSDVVAWYKRNGYQFLAITDHNMVTDPAPLDPDPNDDFLLLGAEEITSPRVVHVNAIGVRETIPAQSGATITETLQKSIDAVRAQKGVPLINHPNFLWAFTAAEMRPLKNTALLEIASGHPLVNHGGDGKVPSTEAMWDELLSSGMRIFGVAVDDAHNFTQDFTADRANPGRAWVSVRAPSLTRDAIVAALDRGDFYTSTGVILTDVQAEAGSVTVSIDAHRAKRYRTVFVGKGGSVLATSYDNPARYAVRGDEGYVRARVEDSSGFRAWTQPFVAAKGPPR